MPQFRIKTMKNDSFYEELEQVFNQFNSYSMNVLLGDFNTKVGREDILKNYW
jgi:hypothetical protein